MRLTKAEWALLLIMIPVVIGLLVRGHWLKEQVTALWQKSPASLTQAGYSGSFRREVDCSLSRQRGKNGTYFTVSVNNNSAYPLLDVVVAVDSQTEGQKSQRQTVKIPAIKYNETASARVPRFKSLAEEIEPVCSLVAYKTLEVVAPPPSTTDSPGGTRVFAPTRLQRPLDSPPPAMEVKVPVKEKPADAIPEPGRATVPAQPAAPDCSALAPNSLSRRECEQQVAEAAKPIPSRGVRIGGPVMTDATYCSIYQPNVPVSQCLNQLTAERQRTEMQRNEEARAAAARAAAAQTQTTTSSSSEAPTRGPSGCRSGRQVMIFPGQMSCAE